MADTKQHTAEFEACVSQVSEQGHEKSSAFAICTDTFQKAAKPVFVGESETQKLHLFCESIKLEGNKVSGVAIHPKRIFHPEEQMTHVYLKAELERAASSLAGQPFGIDHMYILPPPNIVTNSWYCKEKNGVCFEGLVDDHIAQQIREKAFKGISIELDWLRPGGSVEYVNGVAAKNFILTSLHLLMRWPPGDPDAFVKLFEAAEKELARMKEQLVVGPPLPLDQRVDALEAQLQQIQNQIDVIVGKLEVLTGSPQSSTPSVTAQPAQPGASQTIGVMKMKEQNQNQEPEKDEHGCIVGKEKWDTETEECVLIEQPPAQESLKMLHTFLKQFKEQPEVEQCVLDGVALGLGNEEIAEKCDVTLITVQEIRGGFTGLYEALKKLREQVISPEKKECVERGIAAGLSKDEIAQECEVPLEVLELGIMKLREQQGNQEPEKDEHGCLIGKEKWDQEAEKCVPIEETPPSAQAESIVGLRKKLVEVEAQLVKMEKQQKRKAATWKEKYEKLREAVKGAIPMPRVWKSWTPGPQRYVQENLKILREVES